MKDLSKWFELTDSKGNPKKSMDIFGVEGGGLRASNFNLWLSSMNASKKCHWMIDTETLALTPSAAIVQVAMAPFDPWGSGLYCHSYNGEKYSVTHNSVLVIEGQKRFIDPDTKKWWEEKNTANLHLLTDGTVQLPEELEIIGQVLTNSSQVWANSPGFDIALLRHASGQWRVPLNINFRNEWDVRTATKLAGFTYGNQKELFQKSDAFWNRGSKAHNALNDVLTQVFSVQYSLLLLTNKELSNDSAD